MDVTGLVPDAVKGGTGINPSRFLNLLINLSNHHSKRLQEIGASLFDNGVVAEP
jgi:hypothetical protein